MLNAQHNYYKLDPIKGKTYGALLSMVMMREGWGTSYGSTRMISSLLWVTFEIARRKKNSIETTWIAEMQ